MDLTKDEMYYKLTHQLPLSSDSVEISRELMSRSSISRLSSSIVFPAKKLVGGIWFGSPAITAFLPLANKLSRIGLYTDSLRQNADKGGWG